MAVWPEIGLAHGGGGGHAFGGPGGGHAFVGGGHEFGGFTDRGFSPNSGGGVHFLPVASLVAEITAALVTVLSVHAVATFAILLGTLSISASMGSDIRITTRTTSLITTTIGIETPTILAPTAI